MTLGEQARWWGLAFLALLLFIWAFSGAVTPFLAGMAIAYFLDPVADRLERAGLSRVAATAVISILMAASVAGIIVVLAPLLIDQVNQLVRSAPDTIAAAQDLVERLGSSYAPEAFAEGGVLANAFDQWDRPIAAGSR